MQLAAVTRRLPRLVVAFFQPAMPGVWGGPKLVGCVRFAEPQLGISAVAMGAATTVQASERFAPRSSKHHI